MKIWVDSKIVFGLLLYQIFAMSKWLGLLILHQQCVLPRRQLFLKWLVSGVQSETRYEYWYWYWAWSWFMCKFFFLGGGAAAIWFPEFGISWIHVIELLNIPVREQYRTVQSKNGPDVLLPLVKSSLGGVTCHRWNTLASSKIWSLNNIQLS